MTTYYSVKDVAGRLRVGLHTVLGWIRRGELAAIDASREQGGPPRWRITQEALEAFTVARTHSPEPPRARRKQAAAGVTEFYR